MATQQVTMPEQDVLDDEVVEAFIAGQRGAVLRPGGPGYDDARQVWNGLIDRHPALIARCTGAADDSQFSNTIRCLERLKVPKQMPLRQCQDLLTEALFL